MAAKRKRRARKNPTKKRASAKRRHKRVRAANPRKRVHKRRRARANPRRRRARANPRRTHARRRVRRAHASNPRRKRARRSNPSRRRRAHRRNPGIPMWAMGLLAGGVALAAYAVGQAGSFALTQRLDPSRATLDRNRYIGFGVLTVAGLGLTFVSPILGAGLAAGGLVGLAGTELSLALGKVIDVAPATTPAATPSLQTAPAPTVKGLGAVWGGGRQQLGAVYQGGTQRLGAVFQGNRQRLGGSYYPG